MWKAEILKTVPPSGTYQEISYGNQEGTFTRVLFSGLEERWMGIFQDGSLSGSNQRAQITAEQCMILAGGIIYVIDLEEKKLLSCMAEKHFQDAIGDSESLFAVSGTDICVFKNFVLFKVIEGYYFDGFQFESADETHIYFKFWQYGGEWTSDKIDKKKLEIESKQMQTQWFRETFVFSDKTNRELIYPTLRFFLFACSSAFIFFAMNIFLGSEGDYKNMRNEHVFGRIVAEMIVFVIINGLTLLTLFGIGRLYKIKVPKKTYLWLFLIHFLLLLLSIFMFLKK